MHTNQNQSTPKLSHRGVSLTKIEEGSRSSLQSIQDSFKDSL